MVVLDPDRCQPELRGLAIARDVRFSRDALTISPRAVGCNRWLDRTDLQRLASAAGHFGVGGGASVFHMFALIFQLPFTCVHTFRYLPRSVTWLGPYVTT